ncbi:MAG: TonB-dependent receptor [Bacteroidales bacterium]|jgi:hemoglobin/transferrin/lactoferrin receptor protein|nr:TonB-dependent receptor [Bacteroidales bacterium]
MGFFAVNYMIKNKWHILVILLMLVFSKGQAQKDSVSALVDQYLLGVENFKSWKDTSGVQVISASRTSKYLDDLPVTIVVITHEEILKNHFTTLADVLKYLPGIRVSQPGSGEMGEIFQFRGLIGNYYSKILINNLPIKPTVVNGMPIGAQLPIRQAERIEIIYGPSAAIYGADAVTGVINIITREADKGTFVLGDISLGEYDYNYINFMVGGKAGKNKNIMQYSFYGSKTEYLNMNIKQGYEQYYHPLNYLQQKGRLISLNGSTFQPTEITDELLSSYNISEQEFIEQYYPANYEGYVEQPAMENIPSASHMLGLELKFRGFSIAYHNMYRKAHSSIGRSSYLYKYNNPQNYWGEKIQRLVISYQKKWEKFSSSSHLSYLSYRMDDNSSYGLSFYPTTDRLYLYSASDDLFAEQLLTYNPVANLELVSGASYQYSGNLPLTNYQTTPFNSNVYSIFQEESLPQDPFFGDFGLHTITFHNLSSFVQFFYIRPKFTVMGGIRYDMNSQYGDKVNPRLAALYKLTDRTTIKGSLGYAYMAPTSSMAYQSFAYPGGANNDSIHYLAIPNPDLEPESFRAYELGIKRRFFRNILVDLSFYYNQIENLIVDTYEPVNENDLPLAVIETDSSRVRLKKNSSAAQSTLYGLQANIQYKNIIESVKLNAEVSVTFTKKSETLPELGSIIGSFELMPNHIGQLRVSFEPTDKIYIQLDNVWMSKWLRVLIPFEEIYSDPYESVDGYYTLDALANFKVSNNLRIFIKYQNVFDEKYGGINATGTEEDLPINPQQGSVIRAGLTYDFN